MRKIVFILFVFGFSFSGFSNDNVDPKAQLYSSLCDSARKHAGCLINVGDSTVFVGMKNFFQANVLKIERLIIFNGEVIDYRELHKPDVVFSWFNLFWLLSIACMTGANLLLIFNKISNKLSKNIYFVILAKNAGWFAVLTAASVFIPFNFSWSIASFVFFVGFACFCSIGGIFAIADNNKKAWVVINIKYYILMICATLCLFLVKG